MHLMVLQMLFLFYLSLSFCFIIYHHPHNLGSNSITTLYSDSFKGLNNLVSLYFHYSSVFIFHLFHWSEQPTTSNHSHWSIQWTWKTQFSFNCFAFPLFSFFISSSYLQNNKITTIQSGAFADLSNVVFLFSFSFSLSLSSLS